MDKMIEIHPSSVSSVINAGQQPGYKMLEHLIQKCRHPMTGERLNPRWLFGEDTEMWEDEIEKSTLVKLLIANDKMNKRLTKIGRDIEDMKRQKNLPDDS